LNAQKFFKYRTYREIPGSKLKDSIKFSEDYWYKIFKGKRKHKPCYSDIVILLQTTTTNDFSVSCTVKSKTWLNRGK